jgi:mRNA-degrading endonuclease RelE of RelBE toxin-antitoxin system
VTPEPWPIAWSPTAKRALARLPEKPARVGKPLRNELEVLHSARRGTYRMIYRITDHVTIIAIEHRADAYRSH